MNTETAKNWLTDPAIGNLKMIIDAYCKASGRTRGQVCKEFYGNTTYFDTLFAGEQSITIKKMQSMIDEFREKWPSNLPWPPCRLIAFRGPDPSRPKKIILQKAAGC